MNICESALSRRAMLRGGGLALSGLYAGYAFARPRLAFPGLRPTLLQRALAARDRHARRLKVRDTIAIADFDAASNKRRFHIVDVANGRATSFLVAHGRGSDPSHTGWLERFSNQEGSLASSSGAYLAADIYEGKHGRSRRLIGLDPSNSNALNRSIVIHAAWYVSPDNIREHGKLGRSEGCFAVSEDALNQVLARLRSGTMIYADKLAL